MSYRLLDCTHGVGEAMSDGVVKGVFDECSVSTVGRKIVIAKGRMVLKGIDVLFDGREVIPIPDDYGDGRYYLVGVMKVEGGKPYSFYLSLRDELNLSRSGLDGYVGVVESLIAEVGVSGDKVWVRRNLPVIELKNREKLGTFNLKKVFVMGESLNISNATSGELAKISIFGKTSVIDGKLVGVSDFRLISKTGNMFDFDGLDVRDIGFDDKEGYYLSPQNIYGTVSIINNGVEAQGCDLPNEEEYRGVLDIHYGKMRAGNYFFGFKAKAIQMINFLEDERNVSAEVYLNGVKVNRVEGDTFTSINVDKEINLDFTLEEDGDVEFKIFIHGHKVQLTSFYLNENEKIDYVDYGYDERMVEIRDKDGNAYELLSTGYADDEITFDGGECVLIKRVDRGMSNEVVTRKIAHYRTPNVNGMADFEGLIYGEPKSIVYELVEYKRIPLSEACANALVGIRTYREKTNIDTVGSAVKPILKVNYYKDVYSN